MHQSWMLLIHSRYVLIHSFGTNSTLPVSPLRGLVTPSPTAARQRSWIDLPGHSGCVAGAGLVIATNHWSVSIGSTTSPVRPQRGTTILCGFSDDQQARSRQVGEHRLARGVAIHAAVLFGRVVVDLRFEIEDRDHRQPVALADLPVVHVVRRRHLDRAGAEFAVHESVGDDGNRAAGQRQRDAACRRSCR